MIFRNSWQYYLFDFFLKMMIIIMIFHSLKFIVWIFVLKITQHTRFSVWQFMSICPILVVNLFSLKNHAKSYNWHIFSIKNIKGCNFSGDPVYKKVTTALSEIWSSRSRTSNSDMYVKISLDSLKSNFCKEGLSNSTE